MERADYEENRFGYLRSYSQEELKEEKAKCESDIELYELATGIAKSALENDRDRAEDLLNYIEKNNLIKKGKTL